jgi:Zn-dependent metalloprotease
MCCHILPPFILKKLAENADLRENALRDLEVSAAMRGVRHAATILPLSGPVGDEHRTIFNAQNGTNLPGSQVRDESQAPTGDPAVDEAYDYSGATYDFYMKVFNRNSIDDHGLALRSTVHYDASYDNAFWNGQQMIYGDGDRKLFQRFTICLDVVAHELTHGVTQNEAQLLYSGQSGALNESISDVFGSLVKQWAKNHQASAADWLIGNGLFTNAVQGTALRSMSNPGTAYDDPNLGKDPQPADMAHFVNTTDDYGGVHINSGIPNRAFYLAAINIGGYAWQKAGLVWYRTLNGRLSPTADFQAMADATVSVSGTLFGQNSLEQKAVHDAWATVGITPSMGLVAVSGQPVALVPAPAVSERGLAQKPNEMVTASPVKKPIRSRGKSRRN